MGGLLATLASACSRSDGSSDATAPSSNSLAVVKFATFPTAASVPILVADKQGFFKEEGLDPTVEVLPTSATPLVMSGQVDFGMTATSQVVQQRSNDVPIKMVAGLDYVGKESSSQVVGLVVKDDSAIRSASDLAGKTIALGGAVRNAPELKVRKWMQLHGVDAAKVKFVAVPVTAQLTTLKSGDVDAAAIPEPFLSQAQQQGGRVVAYPYAEATPDATSIAVFASDKYLQSHGDIAVKVVRALDKASEYANAHPDDVRALLIETAKVPADVASTMHLTQYRTKINVRGVEDELALMAELGWIKERPSLKDLVWDGR